jgi:hypothetical protein
MSSGDGLMISGMGGTIPLIAMRGGDGNSVNPSGQNISVVNSGKHNEDQRGQKVKKKKAEKLTGKNSSLYRDSYQHMYTNEYYRYQ